jgi:hypothetical protein
VNEGAVDKRSPAPDAISSLKQYLLQRGVATETWMNREAKAFARRIAIEIAASK